MKLKKVVSLALAGVMAVSMLAGCATKPATDPTEGEGGDTNASGYSAEFSKYVNEEVTKLDYVTFADNAEDVAALKSTLGYASDKLVLKAPAVATKLNTVSTDAANFFKKEADLTMTYGFNDIFANAKDVDKTQKLGTVYVIDGTVEISKALQQVADQVNSVLHDDDLPDKVVMNVSTGKITYNYSYVVSVSVVNRATTTFDQVHPSVNAIAVTITRTGTPAEA